MSLREIARWAAIGLLVLAVPFALGAKWARSASKGAMDDDWAEPLTAWPDDPLEVCLVTRGSRPVVWDGSATLTIDGTVQKAGPTLATFSREGFRGSIVPCFRDPNRHIDIADAQGEVWRLLYSTGKVPMRQSSLPPGSRVQLRVHATWGFAKGAGFMLRDDGGPILAIEEGSFGPRPASKEPRPLAVTRGEVFDVRPDGCGEKLRHWLEVEADQRQRAAPGRAIPLTIGGARYGFVNLASDGWRNPRCADLTDRTSWILWRR
jgi:hypothetical protein